MFECMNPLVRTSLYSLLVKESFLMLTKSPTLIVDHGKPADGGGGGAGWWEMAARDKKRAAPTIGDKY
jgi:hypothetical protein